MKRKKSVNPKNERPNEQIQPALSKVGQGDDFHNMAWLTNLAMSGDGANFDPDKFKDHWVHLERLEEIIRHFTKLYRLQGMVHPVSYEAFIDQMQQVIDELREDMGDASPFPLKEKDIQPELMLEQQNKKKK